MGLFVFAELAMPGKDRPIRAELRMGRLQLVATVANHVEECQLRR